MEFFYDLVKKVKDDLIIYILLFIILLLNILAIVINFNHNENNDNNLDNKSIVAKKSNDNLKDPTTTNEVYVDIKGYVKNPGVYKLSDTSIVNDVIILAGGLKKNATTENLNLGKKVRDEMVIYVSNKNQIKKIKSSSETIQNTSKNETNVTNKDNKIDLIVLDQNQNNDAQIVEEEGIRVTHESISQNYNNESILNGNVSNLVNINKASIEELLTLDGIGESKAKAIISYREETLFKDISDIKNVTGIGESIFEKIKDKITV